MSPATVDMMPRLQEVVRLARVRVAMRCRSQERPGKQTNFDSIVQTIREKVELVTWMKQVHSIDPSDMGNYFSFLCPFHPDDSKPNGVIYKEKHPIFQCQSTQCGVMGDIIDLYARKHSLVRRDAIEQLAKQNGIKVSRELFRLQERDKRTFNLWMIKRLPPALAALLRRTSSVYMALLESDERNCMAPEAALFGEDAGFFQPLDKLREQLQADRDTLRQHVRRLVAVGVVQIPDPEVAAKADEERQIRTGRSSRYKSGYFTIPRMTDELVRTAEQRALILRNLHGPITAEFSNKLAASESVDEFRELVNEELLIRDDVQIRMMEATEEVLHECDGEVSRSELLKQLTARGFTRSHIRTHLSSVLTAMGLETFYRLP